MIDRDSDAVTVIQTSYAFCDDIASSSISFLWWFLPVVLHKTDLDVIVFLTNTVNVVRTGTACNGVSSSFNLIDIVYDNKSFILLPPNPEKNNC